MIKPPPENSGGNTPIRYIGEYAECKPILEKYNYSICDLARDFLKLQQKYDELLEMIKEEEYIE